MQPLICPDEHGPEQQLANRLRRGFRALLQQRGADLAYGRKLPRLLREAGLVTDEEIDRHLTNVATGSLDLATAPLISAWGRRPTPDMR